VQCAMMMMMIAFIITLGEINCVWNSLTAFIITLGEILW